MDIICGWVDTGEMLVGGSGCMDGGLQMQASSVIGCRGGGACAWVWGGACAGGSVHTWLCVWGQGGVHA